MASSGIRNPPAEIVLVPKRLLLHWEDMGCFVSAPVAPTSGGVDHSSQDTFSVSRSHFFSEGAPSVTVAMRNNPLHAHIVGKFDVT